MLYGRGTETGRIDRLLAEAREGRSGVLVLRGAAGIGKSALLDHAARTAAAERMRTLRGVGIESETELVFAALHLLLRPGLGHLDRLPAPQADALRGAFGLGPAPSTAADRFLVGLGALTLLSELAGDGPLLCLVDDAQWLDRSSADALLFAARRLEAEGVALILAVRDGSHGFRPAGLPEIRLCGLAQEAAATLLHDAGGALAPHVRDRILAESEGNPLALIELPAALTLEQRAGHVTPLAYHLGPLPLTGRVQEAFQAQIQGLPEPTRTLLLVAAAESTGDLAVILAAARRLGVGADAVEPAERIGLVRVDGELAFRHPLIRAAAYQGAPFTRRLAAHQALAGALEGASDGSRHADARAWHLAAACTEPDETVAAELEQAAERARRRSGHAATSAAYQRAAQLTPDPRDQVRRLISSAEAAMDAGQLLQSRALADRAALLTDDPREHARMAGVRAAIEFEQGSPRVAHGILMTAAAPVAAVDPTMAASMLLEAVRDSWFAGAPDLARQAVDRLHALALPAEHPLQPVISAMTGLAALLAGDPVRGLPPIHAALADARRAQPTGPGERLIIASMAFMVGDDETSVELSARLADDCRAQAMIGWLPHALQNLASSQLYLGRFQEAKASATEAVRIADDTGQHHRVDHLQGVLAWIAAVSGDGRTCEQLTTAVRDHATDHGNVSSLSWAVWAQGLLDLGQGRARAALDHLEAGLTGAVRHQLSTTLLVPDLVEAAVRCEQPERAGAPLVRFDEWATATRQPWARAVALRCKALLAARDEEAEAHYTAAISLHQNGGRPFEEARTRLLFGEWLRRSRRKADARVHLRQALQTFERAGAEPWAVRARSELRATGEVAAAVRTTGVASLLTSQELQIVRLAAQGATNRDIAARLFLSPRTVGYHLHKVFPKLGVASRTELGRLDLGD
ncbi:LuxR family transcriptional regulator [Nonomuraea roseoviolacea subsp. roseoviolacea]|uniref:helix-turn-helix transcriptional regulator n=1 Tax=Nonomuraea roseoviolacea TaxID=103837 RepID=UPI0031E300A2